MATIIQQQWIRFNGDGTLDIIHSSGTFTNPNAISSWAEQNVIANRRFRPSNRGNGEYEIRAVMTGPSTNVSNPIANWTSADANPNITMQVRRLDTDPAGVTQQSNTFNLYVRKKNNINDQVNGSIVLNNILRTEGSSPPPPPPTGPTDDAFLPIVRVVYPGQDFDTGIARVDLFLDYGSIRVTTQTQGAPQYSANDSVGSYLAFTFDSNSPLQLNQYEVSIEAIHIYSDYDAVGYNSTTNHTSTGPVRQTANPPAMLWTQVSSAGGGAFTYATLRIIVRRVSDQVEVMRKRIDVETVSIN